MRRVLALLLALLMVCPLLAACGQKDAVKLFEDGTAVVVYDSSLLTTSEVQAFVSSIEKATGATLTTKREYGGEGAKILLGNIDHENCQAVTKDLRVSDYALKLSGGDLVIGATTATALKKAMQYFLDTVLPAVEKGVLTLTSENDYLYEDTRKTDDFTIGGVGLGRAQIVIPLVYSASEYRTAAVLQQHLKTLTGYELAIKEGSADQSAEGKILIGTSLCTKVDVTAAHSWAIAVNGTTMEIAAESYYGYEAVQTALEKQVFAKKVEDKAMTDTFALSGVGSATEAVSSHDGDIRIMFNNIHGNCSITEYPVEPVAMMMSEVFKEYLPDVLGLQECSKNMRSLGGIVGLLAPEYTEVDVSSSYGFIQNGKVNSTPLFYRSETVEVLKSGFFCFNYLEYTNEAYKDMLRGCDASKLLEENTRQTDGVSVTSGGRKDDSKGVTWAIFRSKATGNIFMAASTHLWWENDETGDRVTRQIQMAYLKDLLLSEAGTYLADNHISAKTMPIFVGGDYNARIYHTNNNPETTMGGETPLILCGSSEGDPISAVFDNTNKMAPSSKRNESTTYHSYAIWNEELGIYENPQFNSSTEYMYSLDYIFMNDSATDMVTIERSAMSSDKYSFLSTDHCPILIDFTFKSTAPKT